MTTWTKPLASSVTRSLIAKVNRYRRLERKRRSFEESIWRIEDQMFTTDVERRMCISRLEGG
jgi:hypothetical protein